MMDDKNDPVMEAKLRDEMRREQGGPFVTRLRSEVKATLGRNRSERRALAAQRRKQK